MPPELSGSQFVNSSLQAWVLFNLCHKTHEKKTSKILHNWGLENVFWIDADHSTDQLIVVITKYWWHIPVEL